MQEPATVDVAPVVSIIPYMGGDDGRPLERVLFSLKELDHINREKRSEQRESERFLYNSRPVIIFPKVYNQTDDHPSVQIAYVARTRNLSCSGISIVVASSLTPISSIDDSAFCVDLKNVSLEGDMALIGLFGLHSDVKWIESRIVRARSLSYLEVNALEIGLQFEDHPTRGWPDAERLNALVVELCGDLD